MPTTEPTVVSRIVRNGKVVRPPRPRLRETSDRGREIASRVRYARHARNLRIIDICDALAIDKGRMSNLERHFTEAAEKELLEKVAEYYRVSLQWLQDGSGESGLPSTAQQAGPEMTLSFDKRSELAARAKARRLQLGLTYADIKAHQGPGTAHLERWEQCLALYREDREAHWEDALKVPRGWLRDETMTADSSKQGTI